MRPYLIPLLTILPLAQAHALESATVGSQATQATVGAINSKVDSGMAALQAQNNAMMKCMSQRKFYAPSDAKKDADGCVGVGDYDLNMANGNNVNLAGGQVKDAYSVANQYGGDFTGNSHGLVGRAASYGVVGYGVYGTLGQTVDGYGLYGLATNNGYGVYGQSAKSWGGVFTSPNYGLYGSGAIYGVYSNGPLCVNGSCITSWRQAGGWGGSFGMQSGNGYSPFCYFANPYTGSCSCPAGYNAYSRETGMDVHWTFVEYTCYH